MTPRVLCSNQAYPPNPSRPLFVELVNQHLFLTAAWLAQLVERRTAVREVEGSSPRPDQHSGS